MILYLMFSNFYFSNLRNQAIRDNEYAAKVISDYIEEEKKVLHEKAVIGAQDDVLFNGLVNDIYIDLSRRVNIKSIKTGKMNKIKYLKAANNINNRIFGSAAHLYMENLLQIFDGEGKKIASVGGLSRNYSDSIKDDYIREVLEKDQFKTRKELLTITKKKDLYFMKGLEAVYLNEIYGVVVASRPLDALFLDKLKKIVNREILLIEGKEIYISTLYRDNNMLRNKKIKKISKKTNKNYSEYEIENRKYILSTIPIRNYKNEIIAKLGIAFDLEEINVLKKEARKKFLAGIVIFLTLTSMITLSLLKAILKPLKKIITGIEKIREGDYNYEMKDKFDKDLGMIAESVQDLSKTIEVREKEIIAKNESLLELDRLKDEFLAGTSHELRTPLNGIIGLADSMINGAVGDLTDEAKTNLKLIVSSGKRLENLVNDILDFSKLKEKNINLKLDSINVYQLVENMLYVFIMLKGEKNLEIINSVPKDLPYAYCDVDRIEQILYNIVGNAVKFTRKGKIEISAKDTEKELIISIEDTGIGIPENKIDSIFKSFEQVDGSVEREYGGTGLGLSISKKLIELHNGTIWVESKLGKGTKFYFTLPKSTRNTKDILKKQDSLTIFHENLESESVVTIPEKLKDKFGKILIVDDEYTNIKVLENYLKVYSFEIESVSSGKDAIAKIQNSKKWEYSLVILDIMMPEVSGYEVCEQIRTKFSMYELPVAMLSAKNLEEDIVRGLKIGANDYLSKPVARQELFARIDTLIGLRNAVKELLETSKKYEKEKQARMLSEKLNDFTKMLGTTLKIEDILKQTFEKLRDYIDYDTGIAFMINTDEIEEYFYKNDLTKINNNIFERNTRKFMDLVEKKKYGICQNVKISEELVYKTALLMPMLYRNNTIGMICFEIDKKEISPEIQSVLFSFINQVGFAVENIRMVEKNKNK